MDKLTIISSISPQLQELLKQANGKIVWSENKEGVQGATLEVFDPQFWNCDLKSFLQNCCDRPVRGLVPCFELEAANPATLFWIDEMGHCRELEQRPDEYIRDGWKQICFFDPGLGASPVHFEFLWPKPTEASRPVLFLDRDGVLIHDVGYLARFEDIALMAEIIPILKKAQTKNYKIIIVTNQSGVARGLFDEAFVAATHEKIDELLAAHQIEITAWYSCPYHYYEGGAGHYCARSILRKPLAGMALKAAWEHSLVREKSAMIGDKPSDQLTGLGIETFLIRGNYDTTSAQTTVYDSFSQLICDLPFD